MTAVPLTRNQIVSATRWPVEESGKATRVSRMAEAARANVGATTIDPARVYGCVDWFMYPDSKSDPVTQGPSAR